MFKYLLQVYILFFKKNIYSIYNQKSTKNTKIAMSRAAASAAGSITGEPEVCKENQCIPYAFKTDGSRDKCAQSYQSHNCFLPSDIEIDFYSKINWPTLRRIIDVEMKSFMNLLNGLYINNTDGFTDLVNLVYPGIVARVGDHRNELFFKAVDLVKSEQHRCNDVNYSFSIECQRYPDGKGNPAVSESVGADTKEFRLFHIAIHSEMPKYYKKDDGRTRSQYACGYFDRKPPTAKDAVFAQHAAQGAAEAGVTGSGPFHYKIDNYDILAKGAKFSKNQCDKIREIICPYKRFEPEIDSGHATGKFQVLDQPDVGFVNLFASWSVEAITSFSERFHHHNHQTNFAHLHSYIYKKFVTFWNDVIFPKVDSQRLRSEATHKILPIIKRSHVSKKKYLDSIRSTAADVVSKIVLNSVRKYTSRGGSRKRNAKRRLTKKMKNRRRRVKK